MRDIRKGLQQRIDECEQRIRALSRQLEALDTRILDLKLLLIAEEDEFNPIPHSNEKLLSLYPLDFDNAVTTILSIKPAKRCSQGVMELI